LAAEKVSVIAFPFCNLTSADTVRIRAYTLATDTDPVLDTGYVAACPSDSPGNKTWGVQATGVNSFAYGGGNYGRVWLSSTIQVTKIVIDINASTNPAGYVEMGKLVIGDYWSVSVVDVQNTSLSIVDTSTHTRTDGGDLYTYVGTRHRKQVLNMPSIEAASRKPLWDIVWNNGMTVPLFVSTFSNNTDGSLDTANMLYGKLVTSPVMSTPYFSYLAATLEIEEV
jgi:hypothetical protein